MIPDMGEFKLLLENLEAINNTEGGKSVIAAVILNFRNMGSMDARFVLCCLSPHTKDSLFTVHCLPLMK